MTRLEYDLLREQEPWMKLPAYEFFRRKADLKRLASCTREQLIAAATVRKLTGETQKLYSVDANAIAT